jgi:A/G-specific adenine glycosylase
LPLSISRKTAALVERWFRQHQRPLPWRETYDPYMVWVSETMLQQTRMEVVLRYFDRFIRRFPDVASLAEAEEADVLAAWSGLGYYRRAKMLREGAREVVERFSGKLPSSVADLSSIKGIGRYTAGAISSIAFRQHAPIVDGNVARIVARLRGIDEPVASPALMRAAWIEAQSLVESCTAPRDFNQGLMELGALVCRPQNPACTQCPLSKHCTARATGREESLPRPRQRKETVSITVPLYVISDGAGRLLMRREAGPLMTSMYHLPHGDSSLLPSSSLAASPTRLLGSFRHTITYRKIEFRLFAATLAGGIRETAAEYAWVAPSNIASFPHPSYVSKALRLIAGC